MTWSFALVSEEQGGSEDSSFAAAAQSLPPAGACSRWPPLRRAAPEAVQVKSEVPDE